MHFGSMASSLSCASQSFAATVTSAKARGVILQEQEMDFGDRGDRAERRERAPRA
jgi:hypothetical protein